MIQYVNKSEYIKPNNTIFVNIIECIIIINGG